MYRIKVKNWRDEYTGEIKKTYYAQELIKTLFSFGKTDWHNVKVTECYGTDVQYLNLTFTNEVEAIKWLRNNEKQVPADEIIK